MKYCALCFVGALQYKAAMKVSEAAAEVRTAAAPDDTMHLYWV